MSDNPYWTSGLTMPRFSKLDRNLRVDVVVVGSGIMGVTAAFLLKKAGLTVALLERDRCGGVDTPHTTAHLTMVTDTRLFRLVDDFGEEHACAAWDAGRAAIQQIATLVERESIDCDFQWVPGYLHAPVDRATDEERETLERDAQLARQLGFDAKFVEKVPFMNTFGVLTPNQARFHPLRYLSALLERIPGDGSHVFEESEANAFHEDPLAVESNGNRIECGQIVLATHVPLMGNAGKVSAGVFQSKLAPYSSYVVGAKLPPDTVPEALFWDTSDPYRYLRVDRHPRYDLVIFGGEDHKTGQEDQPDVRYRRLEAALHEMLPDAKMAWRWTGQVIETNDGLPYIGSTAKGQFVGTGFAGNGMTFGTIAAMMAVDWVQQRKNPWQELFDVNRRKLKGGLWDYVRENLDYPYYYLKDRLRGAEEEPVESLRRGEGRILKVNGERVACSRNSEGRVTMCSPYCTHMGCLVHWNSTDATWDCPCHGSRFHPTGEVLAGPAESPLEPVEEPQSANFE